MKRSNRIGIFVAVGLCAATAAGSLGCRKEKPEGAAVAPSPPSSAGTGAAADAGTGAAAAPADATAGAAPATAPAPDRLSAGDYACGFGSYPDFLCRITEDGDFVTLEKLGGTERFSGSLSKGDEDTEIRFTNAGKDAEPAELIFKRQADGTWLALIPADGEKIGYRLRYLGALKSQFGGQGYAGAISAPVWKE